MNQSQLSEALGFSDRQTLSSIETGDRRIQAAELIRVSEALNRPLDWFVDPFVVEGEARFSWRVAADVSDDALNAFETHIGKCVGLLRHLKNALHGPSSAFAQMLRLPTHPTYEDAWRWGESVCRELDLGLVPAENLIDSIEQKLGISVLFVDGPKDARYGKISGAMCRLPELGVIFINRHESPARRNFDVAHELFHALTWDAMPPERKDVYENVAAARKTRIEQLADNFAAAVLMPTSSIEKLIPADRLGDTSYLANVAHELQVSSLALAYRLFNARMIDKKIRDELLNIRSCKQDAETPKLLSSSFASLLHDGIARGHVSSRKAAKALALTLEQLSELLITHGKTVPFSV